MVLYHSRVTATRRVGTGGKERKAEMGEASKHYCEVCDVMVGGRWGGV